MSTEPEQPKRTSLFSIGEFSRITGLSVKALRLYHAEAILVPSMVDESSGYRYYDQCGVERARAIALLRQMMFSLDEIRDMLAQSADDADTIAFLKAHRDRIDLKIREMRKVKSAVSRLIEAEERAVLIRSNHSYAVEEKNIQPVRIAGMRIKGRYAEAGRLFALLGGLMGRSIGGAAMTLFFDAEYNEQDADFECCFPVTRTLTGAGIDSRQLEGGKAITLLHRGAYDTTGSSYARLFSYIRDSGYQIRLPFREVYLKGPGMIFRGNPDRYLTEIQIMVAA